MNLQLRELNRAINAALAFGSVAALAVAPVYAQDDEDSDTEKMETVQVTGSRIKRTDAEGSVTVTVIDRQQLELSGDVSVADYLRNTTFGIEHGTVEKIIEHGTVEKIGVTKGWSAERWRELCEGEALRDP